MGLPTKTFEQLTEEGASCIEMACYGYIRINEEGEKNKCSCKSCKSSITSMPEMPKKLEEGLIKKWKEDLGV